MGSQNDRVDPLLVQQVSQQKPGWTRTNDPNLGFHEVPVNSGVAEFGCRKQDVIPLELYTVVMDTVVRLLYD